MADDQRLALLVARQDGLVTRPQFRELGFSRGEVRWALRDRWRAVLPNVINTTGPGLTPRSAWSAPCSMPATAA